ncbi:type III PLP-dependent enzyme [Streptomyces sp. NPDC005538]|uniref:type III PLP-dependent enzyme n=1 Tax=unclassified Streptomyces TaxID=2593676 RepID=UPI0033BC6622
MTTDHRVQGIAVRDLADTFGTPLFVYDADVLAAQYRTLRQGLDPSVEIYYSLKANPNVAVCAELHALGAGAEVSSLAELLTAARAGVPAERTMFLGPGKSADELTACVKEGVGLVVCESFPELDLLNDLAGQHAARPSVLLRVNPAFSVKGSGLTMGGKARQFGMDEDQLEAAGNVTARWPHLRVRGVEVFMGTRILDSSVIAENTRRILLLAERLADLLDFPLDVVDVGGGLGVAYFEGEQDVDVDGVTGGVNQAVLDFRGRRPGTRVIMELGRYLTALAGLYVTRIRYVKTSRGERFAVADGGTNHHMAAVGTGSFVKRNFPVQVLTDTDRPATETWHVTGPLCTPNDTLVKNAKLPPLQAGDLIGIHRSGAYGPSASPVLFLGHGHPAEVLVANGTPHLVREHDMPQDLLAKQRLPLHTTHPVRS